MYTILIVDDERKEREGIEKLIKRYGYKLNVLQAVNGVDALEVFEKEKIDILLTDIKMPFMTGMTLIERVHQGGWNPVCIIYSAYGEFEYAQNAIALGVLQYLLKPIKLDEFKKLFEKVFSICDSRKEQEVKKAELEQQLKNVEETKTYQKLLKYLESEEETVGGFEKLFEDGEIMPAVLSSYSYLFSRYWENYENDIKKFFGSGVIIINKDDSQTLLLIQDKGLFSTKKQEELCEKIIKLSQQKYQSKLFIVMGGKCKNIQELKKDYQEIKDQLDYQFFVTDSIYFLKEVNGVVKRRNDVLSLYFEKIITCAKLEDYEGLKKEFEKAFEYVEKNIGFSSIYIKYNFAEIIKKCCEILHRSERMMEVIEDIYGVQSIEQLRTGVLRLLDEFMKAKKTDKEENRTVSLVKNYVHNHYQEYTLNVSSIATELDISVAYLSSVFKMETKENLVKYISKYRMERAKDLLVTTNLKIGAIANAVGYLNTSYFISLFRNTCGCSPAKYRERNYLSEK